GFAGPFIRCFTEYRALFYSSAEHYYRASIGEMAVHTVVPDVVDHIRLIYLMLYFSAWTSFHDHVAAELAGDNNQRTVQVPAAIQGFDEPGNGCIYELFHVSRTDMAILVGVPSH